MSELKPLDIVLHTINPEFEPPFDYITLKKNQRLLNKAIDLADKNGLYYLFITNLVKSSGDKALMNTKRWFLEQKRFNGFINCLSILNEMSVDVNIDYLLIKACTSFPHVPRDVDIYVRSKDVPSLVDYLTSKGMICVHSDPVDTTLIKGEYMKIDLYTGLCYFTVDFFYDHFLWKYKNIENLNGINIPSLTDEVNFMILLVHSLFGHRSISLLDLLQIGSFFDKPIDLDFCRKMAYDSGWAKTFELSASNLEGLHSLINDPEKRSKARFPYLFDKNFIMNCVLAIDGLDMNYQNKLFLNLSLVQDGLAVRYNDTHIYNAIKSFGPTRSAYNNVGHFIRRKRGDLRSVKYEKP